MKKILLIVSLTFSLQLAVSTLAQTVESTTRMSVNDRMMKARAAKAEKKITKSSNVDSPKATAEENKGYRSNKVVRTNTKKARTSMREEKASPADYQSPIDKSQKGPNGEAVHSGARGGKYYINKNGNKTYLSSNL